MADTMTREQREQAIEDLERELADADRTIRNEQDRRTSILARLDHLHWQEHFDG